MGEVISRRAARESVIEDIRTTRERAVARAASDAHFAGADGRLDGVLMHWDLTSAKLTAARAAYGPLAAAIDAANDACDALLRADADLIWNHLGRPANDPFFELLYPGGASYYADGDVDEQPARMELLAEILEAGLHPKLNAAYVAPIVAATRAEAARLAAALDAAKKPRAAVALFDRMLTTIARTGHFELGKLKRHWKAEGLSEDAIHEVIPDRPRDYGVTK